MQGLKVVTTDAVTSVSVDPSEGKAWIHFTQGADKAALEIKIEEAEIVCGAFATVIIEMARQSGRVLARDLIDFELQENLDGASLVLRLSDPSTASIHLRPDQMRALHDGLGAILDLEAAQTLQ